MVWDVAEARCPRCGTALAGAARFCTACGTPLGSPPEATPPHDALLTPDVEPRLVHCPACESANAATRDRCGRCGADLGSTESPARTQPAARAPEPVDGSDTSAVVTIAIVLAGLALLGVLATILSAQGVGIFGGRGAPPPESPALEPVGITAVRASSNLPPSGDVTFGPENLVDGDAATAWIHGASGDGAGEWIELGLAEAVPVTRILLLNGYQQGERFAEYGRVTQLRLVVGETSLTADVLDVDGPQAIDLPEPVVTDLVRLEIVGSEAGARYPDAALSGVEVLVRAGS
jgi:hypothetical protein